MTAYLVVGAGAVGGLVAAGLHDAGKDVRAVDTDAGHVEAVLARGLRVRRPDGAETTSAVRVTRPENDVGVADVVLLAVKAQATHRAVSWAADRLTPGGCAISLQNGLCEPLIADVLGAERTVAAFVNVFADVIEPGVVADGGGGSIVIGEVDGSASVRIDTLTQDMRSCGPVSSSGNVAGLLWSKLAYTAAAAAGSTRDDPIGQTLLAHPDITIGLAHEVYRVGAAHGVTPASFDRWDAAAMAPDASRARADASLRRFCAWLNDQPKQRTGIWRDLVVRRRPSEVPALLGPVTELAATYGVPVPGLLELLGVYARLDDQSATTGPAHLERIAHATTS